MSTKSLLEAYAELRAPAFAVWVALHSVPESALVNGRVRLAKALGYTKRGLNKVLTELRCRGYVDFPVEQRGRITPVTLTCRCVLTSPNKFVKLG